MYPTFSILHHLFLIIAVTLYSPVIFPHLSISISLSTTRFTNKLHLTARINLDFISNSIEVTQSRSRVRLSGALCSSHLNSKPNDVVSVKLLLHVSS